MVNARQTVWRDRQAIEEAHRKNRLEEKQDAATDSFRYIARLKSRIEDLEQVLDSPSLRPTAAVQANEAIARIEERIARAQGVVELAPSEADETENKQIVVGLRLGFQNVSDEMKDKLRAQGIEIGDDCCSKS